MAKPRVLLFDIETSPILGHVWGLWDNTLSLNQIKEDWFVLSWAAKWLGDSPSKVMYADQRKAKRLNDDGKLLQGIWNLLDEADIVITQNGKKFDVKKLNARFIIHGFKPPKSFRHIDTLELSKKNFAFTSNKLEYLTDKLCKKWRKSGHKKFPGFELWKECLNNNMEAWREMESYNKLDVLALEELYGILIPWGGFDFNSYSDSLGIICVCGKDDFLKRGFVYTNRGKFQRYQCKACGKEIKSSANELSKEKKKSLPK